MMLTILARLSSGHDLVEPDFDWMGIVIPFVLCALACLRLCLRPARKTFQVNGYDFLICALTVGACCITLLIVSRFFAARFNEMDFENPATIIYEPIPALIMALFWFALGYSVGINDSAELLAQSVRVRRRNLSGMLTCFGGNAFWLAIHVIKHLLRIE